MIFVHSMGKQTYHRKFERKKSLLNSGDMESYSSVSVDDQWWYLLNPLQTMTNFAPSKLAKFFLSHGQKTLIVEFCWEKICVPYMLSFPYKLVIINS